MTVQAETSAARSAGAPIETGTTDGRFVLRLNGAWTTETVGSLARQLEDVAVEGRSVVVDLAGVDEMDTSGALVVDDLVDRLRAAGADVDLTGLATRYDALLRAVSHARAVGPVARRVHRSAFLNLLDRIGRHTFGVGHAGVDLLNFIGAVTIVMVKSLARPWRLRGRALVSHMEHTGLDALPIVGLLSFLIGVVTAYQGADQLARFGAQIYTANLVGLGILREMGVLITAIIVAGRSGSAFAAQIGTMKVNQEIDALATIGLDPLEVLVLPRVLALVVVLPLLAFYADMLGMLGGAVMATLALDVTFDQFARQLRNAVQVSTFFVGIVKAPLFAFIIAVVGCFEGLQVSQSAESVGLRTTKSVVVSIFLVILVDALLSIFFSLIKV